MVSPGTALLPRGPRPGRRVVATAGVSWLPDRRSPRPSRPSPAVACGGVRSPVTVAGPRRIRTGFLPLPSHLSLRQRQPCQKLALASCACHADCSGRARPTPAPARCRCTRPPTAAGPGPPARRRGHRRPARELAACAATLGAAARAHLAGNVQVRGLRRAYRLRRRASRPRACCPRRPTSGSATSSPRPLSRPRRRRVAVDTQPLVRALDRALCAAPGLAALPGRFLFALDDGRGDVAGLGADVDARRPTADDGRAAAAGADRAARARTTAVALAARRGRGVPRRAAAQAVTAWRIAELDDGPGRIAARLRHVAELAAADAVGRASRTPTAGRRRPAHRTGRTAGVALDGRSSPLGRLTRRRRPLAARRRGAGRTVRRHAVAQRRRCPTCRRGDAPSRRRGSTAAGLGHRPRLAVGRGHRLHRPAGLRQVPWPTCRPTRRRCGARLRLRAADVPVHWAGLRAALRASRPRTEVVRCRRHRRTGYRGTKRVTARDRLRPRRRRDLPAVVRDHPRRGRPVRLARRRRPGRGADDPRLRAWSTWSPTSGWSPDVVAPGPGGAAAPARPCCATRTMVASGRHPRAGCPPTTR